MILTKATYGEMQAIHLKVTMAKEMLAIQSFKRCPEKYKQQNKGNMKRGEK